MQALEQHVRACAYESLRAGAEDDSNFEKIKQENKSAREDIDFMLTSLRGLRQRCENLEAEKDRKFDSQSTFLQINTSKSCILLC